MTPLDESEHDNLTHSGSDPASPGSSERRAQVPPAAKQQIIPPTMTRRMRHHLMSTPNIMPLVAAVRRAQIEILGGRERLWRAINETRLSAFQTDEPGWQRVFAWMCNGEDLPVERVAPLVDYVMPLSATERRKLVRSAPGHRTRPD